MDVETHENLGGSNMDGASHHGNDGLWRENCPSLLG